MKKIYQLILVSALGIGSASAQLASDSPAPMATPAAASANSRIASKSNKLASEVDTVKRMKTTKALVQDKNQKLPSEAEAPRKELKPKNKD
jgi:hypothetical protein